MIKNINTTITEADIRKLIDHYMSGETTNEEEAKLRSWFRLAGDNIPEEWRPLRALFCFVDEERNYIEAKSNDDIEIDAHDDIEPKPQFSPLLIALHKPRTWISSAVAAAAVAIALLVPSVKNGMGATPQNYAVIDGVVYTNPKVINEQVDEALQTVSSNNEDPFSALDMMK